MIRHDASRPSGTERPGKTLVMFALMLPMLLGMVGLSIDSGLLQAAYRQTQNAADSAALAAALDVYNGKSSATAISTGTTYVQSYNNMAGATVTINIPPLTGPNAGVSGYSEAIIGYPYKTSFIQLLGVNKNQTVTARSVAGYHLSTPVEGVMTLQQSGVGLSVAGTPTLSVDGPITVNSTSSSNAMSVTGSAQVYATQVSVSGGVSGLSKIGNYPSGGGTSPVTQNTGVNYADPLASLPNPSILNGVVNTFYGLSGTILSGGLLSPQNISISTSSPVTMLPGIYKSINISGQANVTFTSGIYILVGGGMSISGGATVSNTNGGVMFYNADSTYNALTGNDDGCAGAGPITITGGSTFGLSGLTSGPFSGILVMQDPMNTSTLTLAGNSSTSYSGTFYAPTANLSISGGPTYNNQFIVGSMTVAGNANVNIAPPGATSSNMLYLVE